MAAFQALREPGFDAAGVMKGCAGLYSRPACRDAWAAPAPRDPVEVEAACARAYCGVLPAPLPKACTGDAAARVLDDWPELDAAILAYDLDVDRETAARTSPIQTMRATRTVKVELPRAAQTEPPTDRSITLSLASDEQGTRLTTNGKTWRVSTPPTAAELAPILADLGATGRSNDFVIIEADEHIAHATVMAVMQSCKQAGFQRLAIATRSK